MSAFDYLSEICRLLVSITLLFAATGKSLYVNQFRENLIDSFGVPTNWSWFLVVNIILIESLLGLSVAFQVSYSRQLMFITFIAFTLLTLMIIRLLVQRKKVRCNCFGQSNDTLSYFDVTRNLILLLACGISMQATAQSSLNSLSQLLLLPIAISFFLLLINLKNITLLMKNPRG